VVLGDISGAASLPVAANSRSPRTTGHRRRAAFSPAPPASDDRLHLLPLVNGHPVHRNVHASRALALDATTAASRLGICDPDIFALLPRVCSGITALTQRVTPDREAHDLDLEGIYHAYSSSLLGSLSHFSISEPPRPPVHSVFRNEIEIAYLGAFPRLRPRSLKL
jgi:hypothetical protein